MRSVVRLPLSVHVDAQMMHKYHRMAINPAGTVQYLSICSTLSCVHLFPPLFVLNGVVFPVCASVERHSGRFREEADAKQHFAAYNGNLRPVLQSDSGA